MRRLAKFALWFFPLLASLSFAQGIELACPAGTTPLQPPGITQDVTMGGIKQWLCVDVQGNVYITPNGAVNPKEFNGILFVGGTNTQGWAGTDIGGWINSAYASCVNAACWIMVAPGFYNYTTPIIFSTAGIFPFLNCTPQTTLNYTPTTGTAVTVNAGKAGLPQGWGITGCKFSGPGSGISTGTGMIVGGSNGAVGAHFDNLTIAGFALGITFGNDAFNLLFDHYQVPDNAQGMFFPTGVTNTGEQINFSHGTFSCTTVTWCADYVQVATGVVGTVPFINITDSSIDQAGVTFGSGSNVLSNVHFENPQNAVIGADSFIKVTGGTAHIQADIFSEEANLPQYMIDTSNGAGVTLLVPFLSNSIGTITSGIHVCATCRVTILGLRDLTGISNLTAVDAGGIVSQITSGGWSLINGSTTTFEVRANTGATVNGVTGDIWGWLNTGVAHLGEVNAAGDLGILGDIHSSGSFPGSTAFASLGTPSNGKIVYCPDCTIANPCAGGGTGAIAKRLNGVWVCN